MKNSIKALMAIAIFGMVATSLLAQEQPFPPEEGPGGPGPRGPGEPGMGGHRPPPPLIGVLDANHDGVIDAAEIANASAALKQLDKNGDGELTPDELRPPRPERGQPGDGPRGGMRPPGPPPEQP
jgi:hypothetical protein